VTAPEQIVCVDCGGECHRLSYEPEDGFAAGDIVAYRCRDCLDRWDVELTEEDVDPDFQRPD
jgi:hypothetical protein